MTIPLLPAPDVFTTREIARVAGVSAADVEALIDSGAIASVGDDLIGAAEAVRAVRLLKGLPVAGPERPRLFASTSGSARPRRGARRGPITVSAGLHAAVFGLLVFATFGATSQARVAPPADPARLVFVVAPGPGGGGGGGGLRQPAPPRPAQMKPAVVREMKKSPVHIERAIKRPVPEPPRPRPVPPPSITPAPRPIEIPVPAKPDPPPPVVAPVVAASADPVDARGTLKDAPASPSQGSGNGGGAGTGSGTGIGEGTGAGIGTGSGAGTGGGPYRPGSGIVAPQLTHEVKPDYTEDARRRALSGDVILEIVVRSDGRVGAIKVLRGLGAGLDERAVDAVRQWKFVPARRQGTPVDVMVEVAVEFRLR